MNIVPLALLPSNNAVLDRQLFTDLQHDDPCAMDKIYEQWWEKLLDVAYRKTGDLDIAGEIVQEVFISLWENRHQISIEVSLYGYLLTAVKYRILNFYRFDVRRRIHHEQLLKLSEPLSHDNAEVALLRTEMEQDIDRAVQELPAKMQQVFRMSKLWGKTNQEIADELDLSLQTVKNQLSTALKALRKSLSYLQALAILFFLT